MGAGAGQVVERRLAQEGGGYLASAVGGCCIGCRRGAVSGAMVQRREQGRAGARLDVDGDGSWPGLGGLEVDGWMVGGSGWNGGLIE